MNTIKQDSLDKSKYTSADFNPLIAVKDNHLLTAYQPSYSGTFEHPGTQVDGEYIFTSLPNIRARKLRVTNSSITEALVSQKVVYFSRYFDENTLGVVPDSASINYSGIESETPLGASQVLKIVHNSDTSLHMTVPTPENVGQLYYQVYFKIIDLSSELQPIGIYDKIAGIDINYPAAAIRIDEHGTILAKHGYTKVEIADQTPVVEGEWYRANIRVTANNFSIAVDRYVGGSYVPNISSERSDEIESVGNSKLNEAFTKDSHVLAFASEGPSEIHMENLEVYVATNQSEVLQAGHTKEYYVRTSLDEISVKGPVTGYYMA